MLILRGGQGAQAEIRFVVRFKRHDERSRPTAVCDETPQPGTALGLPGKRPRSLGTKCFNRYAMACSAKGGKRRQVLNNKRSKSAIIAV